MTAPTITGTLTALVLSDGSVEDALATAADALAIADRVRVLERSAAVPASGVPDRVDVLAVDWADGDSASVAIADIESQWMLVAAAGERVEVDDAAAVRARLASAAPTALEVTVGGYAEVRLAPPGPDAIATIGGTGAPALEGLRLLPPTPAAAPIPEPMPEAAVEEVADPIVADQSAAEHLRERVEAVEERRLLLLARAGRDVCWIEGDDEAEPLVTVRIATYNRGPMVAERAIASALAQTYERLEVLVVGDACDDATERAVRAMAERDPRVRFVNLPVRGTYPDEKMHRWMVAGSAPMNTALSLAAGAWLAPCDDDDELTPDHVEVLLGEAKRRRLEMVYSKARCEVQPGRWDVLGSEPLQHGHISHGSVMYSLGLRFFRHSNTCWKLPEPGDWNLWRRMRDAGVRIGFVDHVSYVHYLEAYKRTEGARLHLGCGPNKLQGWVNVDIDPAWEPDVVHDLSQGLPAEPESVDVIYSEHFFEHLPLAAGTSLLRHCRTALRPGGRIRIAMPDLAAVVQAYLGDWRDQEWLRDPAYAGIDTACHMLNYGLREWGHQYVYDEDDLRLRLQQAGFIDVRRCEWNESVDPELAGLETRPDSRLILEAIRP